MIPFDFEYYRPDSIMAAVKIFQELSTQRKDPLFYGGGTEILTRARMNRVHTDAVIDLKSIPECNVLRFHSHQLEMGACLSLTHLVDANLFPMLSVTASGVANHTARSKITLGGNIKGKIRYREAVLPFLLSDSKAILASAKGIRMAAMNRIFDRELLLEKGEFLVQLHVDREYMFLPYVHVRRTRDGKTGYPLLTIAAIIKDAKIRVAFSGVCNFPFRSLQIEDVLNHSTIPLKARIDESLNHMPAPILNSMEGSAEFRKFVLKNSLLDIFEQLEGGTS